MIARSSEPLMGMKLKRSVEDEDYVHNLLSSSASSLPAIVDVRTRADTVFQKTRGGGTEADGHYPNIRMYFTNIDTPTAIRDAYQRLLESKCPHTVTIIIL